MIDCLLDMGYGGGDWLFVPDRSETYSAGQLDACGCEGFGGFFKRSR